MSSVFLLFYYNRDDGYIRDVYGVYDSYELAVEDRTILMRDGNLGISIEKREVEMEEWKKKTKSS